MSGLRESIGSIIDEIYAEQDRQRNIVADLFEEMAADPRGSVFSGPEAFLCAARLLRLSGPACERPDPAGGENIPSALPPAGNNDLGQCDACGRMVPREELGKSFMAFGIETSACDKCRDDPNGCAGR